MRRIFWIVGFALLALLLLPLVEEVPPQEALPADAPVQYAVFLPALLPAPETPTNAAPRPESARQAALLLAAALLSFVPLAVTGSDQNGRVVRKRRYTRGYYLLFRQEAACG